MEPLVGEVEGWRVFWALSDELHSYALDQVWLPGPNTATCDQVEVHAKKKRITWTNNGDSGLKKVEIPEMNRHGQIPSTACSCGYWVFKTEARAREAFGDELGKGAAGRYGHFGGELVMGAVSGWGRAIEGEDGWRFEKAKVIGLVVDDPNRFAGIIERYDIFPIRPTTTQPVVIESRPLAELLEEVEWFIGRYVVLTREQLCAIVLWVAHTWAIGAADTSPYLSVMSAIPRSGKTRLVEALRLLVARPWVAIQPTEAVLFRQIHSVKPTVFLDEIDTMFKSKDDRHEPIRALLNAGNRRGTTVPRVVKTAGGKMDIQEFEVFAPKLLSGIGTPPVTVADRSIPVKMRRKLPADYAERFRQRTAEAETSDIRQQLALWSQSGAVEKLRDAEPDLPDELNDRAQEGWEPLLAIADEAGWGDRARKAAVALAAEQQDAVPDSVQLLGDIREALGDQDRITTESLLRALIDKDPWGAWWGEAVEAGKLKGPSARLSRLLKEFDIRPRKHRFGAESLQGYLASDFLDAWTRNLLPENSEQSEHSEKPTSEGVSSDDNLEHNSEDGTEDGTEDDSLPGDVPTVLSVLSSSEEPDDPFDDIDDLFEDPQ